MTEHPNLAAALVAALADLTVVKAERTAKIPGKDGKQGYSYEYADIGDVVRLTRPALAAHGLVALTPVHDHGNGLACTVTILHAGSDQRLDLGPFPFPHGRDAQATGSMVTYHRRYALVSALGMAAGEDDDGAAAEPHRPGDESRPASRPHADASFLATFNDLASDHQRQVMAWLRERGAKPNAVPAELLDEARTFVASLAAPEPSPEEKRKERKEEVAADNGLPLPEELKGPAKARAAMPGGGE